MTKEVTEKDIRGRYTPYIEFLSTLKMTPTLSINKEKIITEIQNKLEELGQEPPQSLKEFMTVTYEMSKIYDNKNHDYGNSFDKSLDTFGIVASVVRLGDKLNRLVSLTQKESKVQDESLKDTLLDLANYCVMTLMWLQKNEVKD